MMCNPDAPYKDTYYKDVWDGRDRIWLILPDGTIRTEEGDDTAHSELLENDYANDFYEAEHQWLGTMYGWCRGYIHHEDEEICFFPMMGWNLGLEGEKAHKFTKYTEKTGEAISRIIEQYGEPGYKVWIEFEDVMETFTIEGEYVV